MAVSRDSMVLRILARLLARGGSEVRMRQRLRDLRGVLRFNALLGLAVLLPAVLMGWFALATIRSEELLVDAELAREADAVVAQVAQAFADEFAGFEERTLARLSAGQVPDTNLAELSSYLLAAFRFDANRQLASPFVLPDDGPVAEPTPAFRQAWKRAVQLERSGEYAAAADAFAGAMDVARSSRFTAEAALGRARALSRSGMVGPAMEVLGEVYADYAPVRDRFGFRAGDLAALHQAEIALAADPEAGRVAHERLVEELLASRWTIAFPNEAAVARRSLSRLEPLSDPDWLGRQRTRLTERTRQLYWAEVVMQELELFEGTARREPEGAFRYEPGSESGLLWATVSLDADRYAFAFDRPALLQAVRAELDRATVDREFVAEILAPDARRPPAVLASRILDPWFLPLTIVVAPSRPELVAEKKAQRRNIRLVILVLAAGTSFLGLLLSIRLVRSELSSAAMKTDFAANVSHELRSPITQIRLKAESLALDLVFTDDERTHAYDVILRESERLSRLVDNVLDFAAIEAGAKRYTFRPEDVGSILHKSVRAALPQLEAQKMRVETQIPDNLPMVRVDAEAISQVMTNLLSNAAKYGSDGHWVGITARDTPGGVEVVVADKGMGIEPQDLDRLFDHFFRSSDPAVRRQKGTGIGLAIVRYIVEAHGGEIRAFSERGAGTRFLITLPLTPPSEASA